ncbi:MAG: glutamine synthetase family protein [Patulibacter sp.]
MDRNIEYALQTSRQRGVSFVRLWYPDVLGTLKGVAFPISELEAVITDGIGVDGSALEGGARQAELDVVARPSLNTFQVLPWRPDASVARMFADLEMPDGTPFDGDPRAVLAKVVCAAEAHGFSPQIGVEHEFYVFEQLTGDGPPTPVAPGSYFDLTPNDIATDFRRFSISFLEHLGIAVRASYHEAGPSQQEFVLAHADALSTADAVMTFRMATKQAAHNLGTYASFMPKPLADEPGSGMHVHCSLFDGDDRNLFHDDADPDAPLSAVGRQFMAGVLRHAPEFTAVTNQWVNSYTRLVGGHEAPDSVTWSRRHANPLVRVPGHRPGRASAKRIELRSPDAGANPYLVFALMLAAGLRGIDRQYELPAETTHGATPPPSLPLDLRQAVDRFAESELVRETLGDRMIGWFVENKRRDWAAFTSQVTDFERRQSLPRL